jgi:hypothetical protein
MFSLGRFSDRSVRLDLYRSFRGAGIGFVKRTPEYVGTAWSRYLVFYLMHSLLLLLHAWIFSHKQQPGSVVTDGAPTFFG